MEIGRAETPPYLQFAYMILLTVGTAFTLYLMAIVWLDPGRTALSFRFAMIALPAFGLLGLGMTAMDFFGVRFRDVASVSEEGLVITTPTGTTTKFLWSDCRYSIAMFDWRERPNDFMHGKPGIFLKVMLGRKVAWIDEPTFAQVVSISKTKGWTLKHFDYLRDKGQNQWIERRVIATPPGW
jgi:hypothetical protein